ncbi:MAG TPA: hypothetical protein VIH10_18735 [Kribbella sp.]|jgi:hypothetical protein
MTGSDEQAAATTEHQPVERATTDLEHLRQLVLAAGREHVDPAELQAALLAYWRTNQPVLAALAAGVGEQLRLQALQALYEWRANLDRALRSQRPRG